MTNEVLKCIETRRSVRRYRPEQIKDEELDAIYNLFMERFFEEEEEQ